MIGVIERKAGYNGWERFNELYEEGVRKGIRSYYKLRAYALKKMWEDISHVPHALVKYPKSVKENFEIGECECCKLETKFVPPLVLGHCHTSGFSRGWICRYCNSGLTYHWEDPIWRMRALSYLEHFEKQL